MDTYDKMKIAILIRVYDRLEDLYNNLRIISDTWKDNDYYVLVVSNGKSNGFIVSEEYHRYIDKLIELEDNAGHRKGNSQLLLEGLKEIPNDREFTLILEADTWVYGDTTITKYTKLLRKYPSAVWASADWYDKIFGLATDYALIKTSFLKEHPEIFDFDLFPECHISNVLRDNHKEYIWIKEQMPVHIPSYVFCGYPYVPNIKEKRFYVFPKNKAVTHHIEYLKRGMEQKKEYFNIVSDTDYFKEHPVKWKKWKRFKMKFWINFSHLFIKRSWYSAKRYLDISQFSS